MNRPRQAPASEAAHFVSGVLDRRPIVSDATSGRRVVAALEAGAASMAKAGETIRVDRR